jgi:hypothetical protein
MSTSDAQHSDLNAQTVSQIANLARLSFNDTQSAEYAQSLNKILGMMETLKGIDTTGIEPLKAHLTIHNLYALMWSLKQTIVKNIKLLHLQPKMACILYLA